MVLRRKRSKGPRSALRWTGLLLVFLCKLAQASDPLLFSQLEHKKWGATEGAPANAISILEDKTGLLWFTSPGGLYTFDGLTFAPFQIPEQVDPANAVPFTLSPSPSGNIWGASRLSGLIRIDPQHRVTAYGSTQGLPAHPVQQVVEDPRGEVWAIADRNLYHLVEGRWRDETKDRGLPPGELIQLLIDHQGAFWFTTRSSLFTMGASERTARVAIEHLEAMSRGTLEDPRGGLWIAFSPPDHSILFKQVNVPGHSIWYDQPILAPHKLVDAKFDRSGALWISGEGIERVTFQPQTPQAGFNQQQSTAVVEHFSAADGLSSDSTRYLMQDSQNDIWVATQGGLDRFRVPVLVKARLPHIDSSTLPDLAQGTDGQVWLGGKDAPLYTAAGNEITAAGSSNDSYLCLFQDREGGLWFNNSKGLWHQQKNHLDNIAPPEGTTPGRLRQVVQLADGSMLFSFFDRGVWRRMQETWQKSSLGAVTGEYPLVLFVDSQNAVWAGYASGKVTRGNGFQEQSVRTDGRSLGPIAAFYEGSLGILAAGQRGMATLIAGQLHSLRFADRQLAENVTGLVQSADGDLWLNGRNGVARIRAGDYQQGIASGSEVAMRGRLFTEADLKGPAPFFYDLPTAAKDKTGRLWFNTAGALVYVDPSSLSTVPTAPNVSIIALLADGVTLSPSAAVPPGTHTLRIQYFGSNLSAPEDVRYRYRLKGVDDEWQYVDQRTEAVYTNLRPRTLDFEVSARNADNRWSAPAIVRIRVEPTFVQKPSFLLLCFLLVAGLVFLLYRLRVAWLMRGMRERADARLEERVRLARDLHDTLLQGFQGLILRLHVAAQRVPEQTDVRVQLDGALVRAEEMMVEGRNRIVLLRADDLSGLNLVVALQSVGEELAQTSTTSFSVTGQGEALNLKPPVKDELYWIAREALSNAFRHAEAAEVRLLCEYGSREFRLICQDDGRGMDVNLELKGRRPGHYGLAGMRERAAKINGKLTYQSAPMQGTRIELSVHAKSAYEQRPFLPGVIRYVTDKLSNRSPMR